MPSKAKERKQFFKKKMIKSRFQHHFGASAQHKKIFGKHL